MTKKSKDKMTDRAAPNVRAFTLIELMVSVAIVVVLLAITFPILSRAKWEAKFATSTSNLKQIYAGTMLYIADTDGLYPHNRNIEGLLQKYDPEVTIRTLPTDSKSPGRLVESLVTYIGSRDVFFFSGEPDAHQDKMVGPINVKYATYTYIAYPNPFDYDTWKGWPMVAREGDIMAGWLWTTIPFDSPVRYPKGQVLLEHGSVRTRPEPGWGER